jgi:Rod binding domain-containing protein
VTIDPLGSLPVVAETSLPADVRGGSEKDRQTYQAALGFERELLGQLTQAMVGTTGSSDDPSSDDGSSDFTDSTDPSSDPAIQAYNQMLPDQLADALIAGGGTGLAANLYQALRQEQS